MRKCVWELLGYHVAQEKIPKVIELVIALAQKTCDRIPQSSTVNVPTQQQQESL